MEDRDHAQALSKYANHCYFCHPLVGSAAVQTMMFNPRSNVQLEILASGPPGGIRPRSALLFVHGLGHDATCWRNWMHAASEDGYAAYAVSLRGHGGISRSLCGESPWVQYQLLFHLPARVKSEYPLLSVHSTHDRMVPARSARATARRYGADVRELAGIGHDMMLDGGWEESWNVISDWWTALRVEAISRTARPAE